jgi:MFS family permease
MSHGKVIAFNRRRIMVTTVEQHRATNEQGPGRRTDRLDLITATAVVTPADRIRWGPIIGGLFSALTTLTVLTVVGAAVGLTAYDPGDRARTFGLGAGIWAAVSALLAFGIGGCIAAYSAGRPGRRYGVLNGSMVWVVSIPLLLFLIGGGLATLASTAANAASAAAASNTGLVDRAQEVASNLQQQVDPSDMRGSKVAARNAAWWTLLSLGLGFAAAAVGGYCGARAAGGSGESKTSFDSADQRAADFNLVRRDD